jgi:signal transduction histidine kinase
MSTEDMERFRSGETGLDEVIATALLDSRPARMADFQAESEELAALAETMAETPTRIAQHLVEAARKLTSAHSAGLSLLEENGGEPIFRWIAVTGEFERYRNGTMPRHFSPCGLVIDQNRTVLMLDLARHYLYVNELHCATREVLLTPFHLNGKPIGTVWVVAHSQEKAFDAEDRRIVERISKFAAAAVQTVGLVDSLQNAYAEKTRALEKAREQTELLRRWFDQAPGFVALLRGPDHVFEMLNDAYSMLIGRRDVLGKSVFDALPEVREQGFSDLLDQVFRSGQPYVGRDVSLVIQQATDAAPVEVFLDFVYQPVFDEKGEPTAIFVQGHDVTDRHIAVESLREADQRKDDFIATVAHELRNPLAPIKVSAQVLRLLDKGQDERVRKALDIVDRQSALLSALVEDLLDAASIRSGKMELSRRPVNIQEVLAQALEGSLPQLELRQHQLDTHVPEQPLMVSGDVRRLTQALMNLLNNAARYTPANGAIDVSVLAEDAWIHICVKDNGIGIAAEVMPTIFNMYAQAPGSAQRTTTGLGIGLALVTRIAELHGGTLHARSEGLGRGSEFTLTLPRLAG